MSARGINANADTALVPTSIPVAQGSALGCPASQQDQYTRSLAALQQAFPDHSVSLVIWPDERPRYEAVTRNDSNPWCVISADPDEIWHELKGGAQ